jgi:polyvinyl alcohol dehydrogenase (cytochrome)
MDDRTLTITTPRGTTPRGTPWASMDSEVYHSDPDHKGAAVWERRVGHGGMLGGIQWGSATDNHNVYVPLSDIGAEIKKNTQSVPFVAFNRQQGGGIFAYDLATGERRWAAPPAGCGERPQCSPAQSAAATAIPDVVFSGSVDGHMRAYSVDQGKVVWDFDTARDFATINNVVAKGGSLDGPGPTIAEEMLFMSSGYTSSGSTPGNVLLGLSVDGK